jgi:FkbM family methyltransferase
MEPPPQAVDISQYLARPSGAETEILRLFRPQESLTIFEIGCCEGEDTVRYARRFPNARIFAFEPLPDNQRLVLANLGRYGVRNAELVPVALSDRGGEATFHVSSGRPKEEFAGKDWNYGNKSSSLLAPAGEGPMHGWIEFKQKITVQTDTLDHFASTRDIARIDFVHMDVQGAEQLVLSGASRMLPSIVAVWLEVSDKALYQGQALRPEIARFMGSRGFSLAHEVKNGVEGDQLYVNRRFGRVWPYLASRRAAAIVRGARFSAGRWKSRLLKPSPPP